MWRREEGRRRDGGRVEAGGRRGRGKGFQRARERGSERESEEGKAGSPTLFYNVSRQLL